LITIIYKLLSQLFTEEKEEKVVFDDGKQKQIYDFIFSTCAFEIQQKIKDNKDTQISDIFNDLNSDVSKSFVNIIGFLERVGITAEEKNIRAVKRFYTSAFYILKIQAEIWDSIPNQECLDIYMRNYLKGTILEIDAKIKFIENCLGDNVFGVFHIDKFKYLKDVFIEFEEHANIFYMLTTHDYMLPDYIISIDKFHSYVKKIVTDKAIIETLTLDRSENSTTIYSDFDFYLQIAECVYQNKYEELVMALSKKKVFLDYQDENRQTLLIKAKINNYYEIFCTLLAEGADPEIKDNYGKNCIDYCKDDLKYMLVIKENKPSAVIKLDKFSNPSELLHGFV
jgi:hypothetical protein